MKKLALLGVLLLVAATTCLAGNDWELSSDEDGIKTWAREVEGSPIVALKGEAVINASLPKVASVLDDSTRRTEWVCNCLEAKTVRMISESERIEYNRTKAPWPISDRDFVYSCKITWDAKEKTLFLAMKSVEDKLAPVDEDKAVRGELLESSYKLTAIDDYRTRVTVEIQVDPKGSIPKWVVNWAQKGWPRETLDGIRNQCAKSDVKELALVRRLLDGGSLVAAVSSATKKG